MIPTKFYFDLNERATASLGMSPAVPCAASFSPATPAALAGPAAPADPAVSAGGATPILLNRLGTRHATSAGETLVLPLAVTRRGDHSEELVKGEPEPALNHVHEAPPQAETRWRPMSLWDQIIMYFGVLLGVFFSTVVQQFNPDGPAVNLNVTLGALLVAALVALLIIPVVFEKLSVRPDAPFIVKFGLFVQNGVFWQVIIGSIGKTFAA